MAINIGLTDSRNNTITKTIPFIKYTPPNIQITKIDNGVMLDDTLIILPPKTIITMKATSVIGLKEVRYKIANNQDQVIPIPNNAKEYIFTIEIEYNNI